MVIDTKAIVFTSIKYGDTSLIVRCFTEQEGCKSYMLKGILASKRGKLKPSYFQPLTQLKIVGNHNSKGNLNSLKEVHISIPFKTIYSNVLKQSIVFFLSEVLNTAVQEEEEYLSLYNYIEASIIWLDVHDQVSNFHLLFMLNLTKYLGFYPDVENQNYQYFDLVQGCFVKEAIPSNIIISGFELIEFRKLLGINIDALHLVTYNGKNRHQVLDILIRYFELHLTGFRRPKSLEVLRAVFS